jgi:ABC-type Fe3+-hydroxamate transport system substrate-binding protein
MAVLTDDTGAFVDVPGDVRRVVSLVPSLTESLAATERGLLVGVTDWCTHPGDLDVARIGGTKNPDVDAIVALAPDLVVANEEENRAPDLQALRDKGIAVWVTDVRDVAGSFRSLARMLAACRLARPRWLDEAEAAWRDVGEVRPGRRVRAVVPIWRRPWMALGRDTFAGDVLRLLGVENVLAGSPDRYPRFDPADLPAADLVVLPDEPYRFTAGDGPEAFPEVPSALVDGRSLTWYGPSMLQAPRRLLGELRAAR